MNWHDAAVADVGAWRKAMRAELLAKREALPAEERRREDERITELLLLGFPMLRGASLGFYWPMKGEFDARVATHRLRQQGARTALPVVVAKGAPLEYREWHTGVETTPGVFKLPVPVGTPVVSPDAVLAPPVGFDAHGYRLGYGGGYFDRTLASLTPRPIAIGVARAASRIETIHPQAWDIPMDFIVTGEGIHHAGPGGLRHVAEFEEVARLAENLREGRRLLDVDEVAALLNTLLEAERAGAKVLGAFVEQMAWGPAARAELLRVQRDEAANCTVLKGLLEHLGRERSARTGDFLGKALAVEGGAERLAFLNRGQAWVARRIEAALPRIADARVREALREMHASHLANIAACEALGTPAAGGSSNGA